MNGGASTYERATRSAALVDRSRRTRLVVEGRAPGRMLAGVLTSRLPGPERSHDGGPLWGEAVYSTLLTSKGRLVTDLRILRIDAEDGAGGAEEPETSAAVSALPGPGLEVGRQAASERFLIDLPRAGAAGAVAHFERFLPPRFATVSDVSAETGMLTVVGPDAARLLSLHACGLRLEERELAAMEEGVTRSIVLGAPEEGVREAPPPSGDVGNRFRIIAASDLSVPAFDVLGSRDAAGALARTLIETGVPRLDHATWETLRVEGGRPAYGVDMDDSTIPLEAGLGERAFDHSKGCYTGQEVIVRIRHRGHVNRRLCGLAFEADAQVERGAELYAPEVRGERSAGVVTSVVDSPRMGLIGLGYVRREVEAGRLVRVGDPAGPGARVVELTGGGWGP